MLNEERGEITLGHVELWKDAKDGVKKTLRDWISGAADALVEGNDVQATQYLREFLSSSYFGVEPIYHKYNLALKGIFGDRTWKRHIRESAPQVRQYLHGQLTPAPHERFRPRFQ